MKAPALVMARARIAQHQIVASRLEQREAGIAQDLERILERTCALAKGEAVLAIHRTGTLAQTQPLSIDRVRQERREQEPPSVAPAGRLDPGPTARSEAARNDEAIQQRGQDLVALIDRIDRFVRDGRPALTLSLGAVGWTVEFQRTGAGEVSLSVRGPGAKDFPARAALSEALDARGIKLGALHCQAET